MLKDGTLQSKYHGRARMRRHGGLTGSMYWSISVINYPA